MSRGLVAVLWCYKKHVSPWLPPACRFSPTCSEFGRLAVLKFGFWRGAWHTARRVLRCHPLHPGGIDLP